MVEYEEEHYGLGWFAWYLEIIIGLIGIIFKKGELNLHVGKSNKEEPKNIVANTTYNKSDNQGNKKRN